MPESEFRVFAELSPDEDRIWVKFPFDARLVRLAKTIHGYHFYPRDHKVVLESEDKQPFWAYPRDLTTARLLREKFDEQLDLGPKLRKWAKAEVDREAKLTELTSANDAELENVEPELAEYLHPYQRSGAAVMAVKNVINSDEPGLGKTIQALTAIAERGNIDKGAHLIIAPKTSLEVVWESTLNEWFPEYPNLVFSGDLSDSEREETLEVLLEMVDAGDPFFLIINPAFVTYFRDKTADKIIGPKGREEYPLVPRIPELYEIEWMTMVVDEYHLFGLANIQTQTFRAFNDLKLHEDGQKILLSGTPMGGKPIKLWGALHFLEPETFTSMWRWAHQWLVIEEVDTGNQGTGKAKKIHGVRKDREEEFNKHLAPHLVRRTKAEVKQDLPPKDRHYIPCEMTPTQAKQYAAMAADAEVKIEEEHLTAVGILAEYMRLKQFADARHKVKQFGNGKMEVLPTQDSGKLPQILRLLEERGITVNPDDAWGDEQIVIGSQFSTVVDMVHAWLNEQGIPAAKLTGSRTEDDDGNRCTREELINKFQAGEIQVLVISTKAGGVSITLDNANTLIVLDETWDPDDQTQLEDRIHRISRIHQVTIFYLYSKGTIEEYIQSVVWDKADLNRAILDLRRVNYRAVQNVKVAA